MCQHDNSINVSSQVGYAHCKGECYDSPVVNKTESRSAIFGASISLIFKMLYITERELGMLSIASKQNYKRLACI